MLTQPTNPTDLSNTKPQMPTPEQCTVNSSADGHVTPFIDRHKIKPGIYK
jgi:hypothetical protein